MASTLTSLSTRTRWRHYASRLRGPVGLAVTAYAVFLGKEIYDIWQLEKDNDKNNNNNNNDDDDDNNKKNKKKFALTIDFDKLELVQKPSFSDSKRREWQRLLRRQFARDDDPLGANEVQTFAISEFVQLIHDAAQDDQICALFGRFGGSGTTTRPIHWADLEEVRNALTAFSQSHRRHWEPNVFHDKKPVAMPLVEPKALYCFAENLGNMADPGNPQYYLASAFGKVHLQTHGELQLFGLLKTNFFLRELLEKYGIELHVLKHGEYKTAPNTFTETTFTRAHKESTFHLVAELDADLCLDITTARPSVLKSWINKQKQQPKKKKSGSDKGASNNDNKSLMADNAKILQIWQKIHESGTFPAVSAWTGGLVDCLTRRDPLPDLLAYNRALQDGNDELAASIKAKWEYYETDFDHFKATKYISLQDYRTYLDKIKRIKANRDKWAERFLNITGATEYIPTMFLSKDGKPFVPKKDRESVATMFVVGAIGDEKANDVVAQLRVLQESIQKYNNHGGSAGNNNNNNNNNNNIKQPPKALVLRVVSPGGTIHACEKISQELRALDIPVVVSFGHVAASGGYYISAFADQIFGSNKTLTGSVGVFGIRADLTGLAHKYGVRAEHVAAGNLAATYSAFAPMTKPMYDNMAASVDRWYDQFKDVVQQGRRLRHVEELAQGKVWTGRQAKGIGLLDEIGGYDRALIYAKRKFCQNPALAQVVALDEPQSFLVRLAKWSRGEEDSALVWQDVRRFLFGEDLIQAPLEEQDGWNLSHPSAAMNDFGKWLLSSPNAVVPGTLSGVYMTIDENTAVHALLREQSRH